MPLIIDAARLKILVIFVEWMAYGWAVVHDKPWTRNVNILLILSGIYMVFSTMIIFDPFIIHYCMLHFNSLAELFRKWFLLFQLTTVELLKDVSFNMLSTSTRYISSFVFDFFFFHLWWLWHHYNLYPQKKIFTVIKFGIWTFCIVQINSL